MSPDITSLVWGALMPGITTTPLEPWVVQALERGVGAVCLFDGAAGSPSRTRATVRELRALAPGVLVAADEEGGEVTRLQADAGSSFLSPWALGVIADSEVTRATGRLIGDLLRGCGVDWAFAPVVDVNVNPANPIIGVRSFSDQTAVAASAAAAFIAGLQSTGTIATAKHFPGHGDTHIDSHWALPTLDVGQALLGERELAPFRAAIEVGVGSVMTGHLFVPALDPEAPASLSRSITTELLRGELGHDGLVVTDAMDMAALSDQFVDRPGQAVVAALNAGADLVCLGLDDQERALAFAGNAILRALADGSLEPALLERAAERRGRALARRALTTAGPRAHDDEILVAVAADRSLRIHGDVVLAHSQVDVLRVCPTRGPSSPEPAWGLSEHLRDFGLDVRDVQDLPRGADRSLVIEVRDAWARPELVQLLHEAVATRPDAIVVDVGAPGPYPPHFRGMIITHGIGRLSCSLAACRLTGQAPGSVALGILREARA